MKLYEFTEALVEKYLPQEQETQTLNESLNEEVEPELEEDFWNPGKEFQDFEHLLYDEFDESGWNEWDQIQRDAFAEQVAQRYLEINPTPTPMFYEDLTDNNFHTYRKAFERLLGEGLTEAIDPQKVQQCKKNLLSRIEAFQEVMSGMNKEDDMKYGLTNEQVELLDALRISLADSLTEEVEQEEEVLEEARQPRSVHDINKRELIDWLGDHDQAFEDMCDFFHIDVDDEYCEEELAHYQLSDLLNWISDHEQLYDDMLDHFNLSGMTESLTEGLDLGEFGKYYDLYDRDAYGDIEDVLEVVEGNYGMEFVGWVEAKDEYYDRLMDDGNDIALAVKEPDSDNIQIVQWINDRLYPIDLQELESMLEDEEFDESVELDEAKGVSIRQLLADNGIMDTLDKDPQGSIDKALEIVANHEEVSAKDKYDFQSAVGRGPLSKRVSSLASYAYDIPRVGKSY